MNAEPTGVSISVDELLARPITYIEGVFSIKGAVTVSTGDFLKYVRNGFWADLIKPIRAADPEKAAKLKDRLPAIMPSGTFGGLKECDMIAHSGILCMDFDNLGYAAVQVRNALMADPHVIALFSSPRANGIKALVPIPTGLGTHKASFAAALAHFTRTLPNGVKIDTAPSNASSKCFVSWDPNSWLAKNPRTVIDPRGWDIDMSHGIQSNEKEPSALVSSGSVEGESAGTDPSESEQEAVSTRTPPPAPVQLTPFVESKIWPNWVAQFRHHPAKRNEFMVSRVPILINLVHEEMVARLLLHWFDRAPPGMFKPEREQHWNETWSMIKGCLESWPKQERLHRADARKYLELRDHRQRASFRICHSLSLTKENRGLRRFFLSAGQLSARLGAQSSKAGDRQLKYLIKAEVIREVSKGPQWAPGQRGEASTYEWLLG